MQGRLSFFWSIYTQLKKYCFTLTECNEINTPNVLSVSCKLNTGYDFYLVGVYQLCSGSTNIFLKAFSDYLESISNWDVVMIGDFNINILNDEHNTNVYKQRAAHGFVVF